MVCRWQLVNAKDMDVFRHVSLVIRVPAVQLVVHRETCSSRLISAYALMDIIWNHLSATSVLQLVKHAKILPDNAYPAIHHSIGKLTIRPVSVRKAILRRINNKNAKNVIHYVKLVQWFQQFVQVAAFSCAENWITINAFACKDIMKLANYPVFSAHRLARHV